MTDDKGELISKTNNLLQTYSCLKTGPEPIAMVLFSMGTLQIILFSYQLTIDIILMYRVWSFMTIMLIQIIITGTQCQFFKERNKERVVSDVSLLNEIVPHWTVNKELNFNRLYQ